MASVIKTKINRLASAKAAIKAAIEGKGVTVPDATLLDGMAALIESIEAGGGGKAKIATGSFTPAENCNHYVITHNLGEKPNLAICICKSIVGQSFSLLYDDSTQRIAWFNSSGYFSGTSDPSSSIINQTNTNGTSISSSGMYNATENTIKAGNERSSGKFFLASSEYLWIMAVI